MLKNLLFANRQNKYFKLKGGCKTFYNFALPFSKVLKNKKYE